MSFVDLKKTSEVTDFDSWAEYAQQQLGVPYPTAKDRGISMGMVNKFFKNNPRAGWSVFVKTVQWAKAKKRRPATLKTLVSWIRFAWADGFIPELNEEKPKDDRVEEEISKALTIERDPVWRERLLTAQGNVARREIWESWCQKA